MDFGKSLALIAPELVLSLAGLVLLLAAAWFGTRHARTISVLAVTALFGAGFLLVPALHDGAIGPLTIAFDDQFRADGYAAFAKATIYLAAIACLVIAPRLLRTAPRHAGRIPGAGTVRDAGHEHHGVGHRLDDAVYRVGAEQPCRLRPRIVPAHRWPLGRSGAEVFRSWAGWRAASCFTV